SLSSSGTGPEVSFTGGTGKPNDFVISKVVGDIPDPTDPSFDIDWQAIDAVSGGLATQVFRIDTIGGQPPAACVAGDADIQVKFTAKLFLY
ncbi:hypothetical protein B0H16DRAFT_1239094, partial [Mycena metata]